MYPNSVFPVFGDFSFVLPTFMLLLLSSYMGRRCCERACPCLSIALRRIACCYFSPHTFTYISICTDAILCIADACMHARPQPQDLQSSASLYLSLSSTTTQHTKTLNPIPSTDAHIVTGLELLTFGAFGTFRGLGIQNPGDTTIVGAAYHCTLDHEW